MSFKISKPTLLPARGKTVEAALAPIEKLNAAVNMLGRVAGDPMQSAVRLGELFDAGLLRYNAAGLLVAGPALDGGAAGPITFKNYIINGDHRWWQRGTSRATVSSFTWYLADRWVVASAYNSMSANRQAFDVGQTTVPGQPTFFQRVSVDAVSANADAFSLYTTRLENLRRFSGKKLTISWYAKANAPREMSLELVFQYGTGGSPLEIVNAPKKHQLTTNWQRFQQTMVIPSMAGKLHNMADSQFLMQFWLACGTNPSYQTRSAGIGNTTGIIDIACIQCEEGDDATDFEFLPPAFTLLQCQRYFEKSYPVETPPGTGTEVGREAHYLNNSAAATWVVPVRFKVTKRGTPTCTVYGSTNGTAGVVCQDDGSSAAAAWSNVGDTGAGVSWTNSASRIGGFFQWIADAEW